MNRKTFMKRFAAMCVAPVVAKPLVAAVSAPMPSYLTTAHLRKTKALLDAQPVPMENRFVKLYGWTEPEFIAAFDLEVRNVYLKIDRPFVRTQDGTMKIIELDDSKKKRH